MDDLVIFFLFYFGGSVIYVLFLFWVVFKNFKNFKDEVIEEVYADVYGRKTNIKKLKNILRRY